MKEKEKTEKNFSHSQDRRFATSFLVEKLWIRVMERVSLSVSTPFNLFIILIKNDSKRTEEREFVCSGVVGEGAKVSKERGRGRQERK